MSESAGVFIKIKGDASELIAAFKQARAVQVDLSASAAAGAAATARLSEAQTLAASTAARVASAAQAEATALRSGGSAIQQSIAAVTGLDRADKSAAASASAFTSAYRQSTAGIIEASTGIGAATKSAAESAAVFGTHMAEVDQILAKSQGSGDGAHKSLDGLFGALKQNRLAVQEFGHSGRSMIDMLASGRSAMDAVRVEGARLVQAFAELNPSVMGLAAAGIAAGAVALALGGDLIKLATQASSLKTALDAAQTSQVIFGQGVNFDRLGTAESIQKTASSWHLWASEVAQVRSTLEGVYGLTAQQKDKLQDLSVAISTLGGQDSDKVGDDLAKTFAGSGKEAVEMALKINALNGEQRHEAEVALAAGDAIKAKSIALDALSASYVNAAKNKVMKERQNIAYVAVAAGGDGYSSPEDAGLKHTDGTAPDKDSTAESVSAGKRRAFEIEEQTNKALIQREAIQSKIEAVTATLSDASANERTQAEAAIKSLKAQLENVHTEGETDEYRKQIAALQAKADLARRGSNERIDALKQEQAITAAFTATPYNDAGKNSEQTIQTGLKIATAQRQLEQERYQITAAGYEQRVALAERDKAAQARIIGELAQIAKARGEAGQNDFDSLTKRKITLEREAADEGFRLYEAGIRQREALAKNDVNQQVALQQELTSRAAAQYGAQSQQAIQSQTELVQLQQRAADEALRIKIDALREAQKLAEKDYPQQLKIEDQILAAIEAAEGKKTEIYAREVEKRRDIQRQAADFERALLDKKLEAQQQVANIQEQSEAAHQAILRQLGEATTEASAAEQIKLVQAKLDGNIKTLQAERIAAQGRVDLEQAADNKILIARAKAEADIQKIRDQDAVKQKQSFDQVFTALDRSIQGSVTGIIQGTTTARKAFANLGTSIVSSVVGSIVKAGQEYASEQLKELVLHRSTEAAKVAATSQGAAQRSVAEQGDGFLSLVSSRIASWLGLEAQKTGATEAGTAARAASEAAGSVATATEASLTSDVQITDAAGVAAANAYAVTAAIPVTGPELAPAAAAQAFGDVQAFSIASAARGWARVPFDGAMTELHKDEMVLPAAIASPLRAALDVGSFSAPAPPSFGGLKADLQSPAYSGQSSQPPSMVFAPQVTAMDARGVDRVLRVHGDRFMQFFMNAQRNGAMAGRS